MIDISLAWLAHKPELTIAEVQAICKHCNRGPDALSIDEYNRMNSGIIKLQRALSDTCMECGGSQRMAENYGHATSCSKWPRKFEKIYTTLEYDKEPVKPTLCVRCNSTNSFHRLKSDPMDPHAQTAIDILMVCANCGKLAHI